MAETIKPGSVFRVPYPMRRGTFYLFDPQEGCSEDTETWIPGTREIDVYPDDSELVADAMGTMVVTVVSLHRPGTFTTRVFFVRTWIDPAGKPFGKKKLRIKGLAAFRRDLAGYRHEYRLEAADA